MATNLWERYRVTVTFETPFGASLPQTQKEIDGMLNNRKPTRVPEDATPIADLADDVAEKVGVEEEDGEPAHLTFPRDEDGPYLEGRTWRGHLKDAATQCAIYYKGTQEMRKRGFSEIKQFRAKFVNATYVADHEIPIYRPDGTRVTGIDGTETRPIHVMTMQGPRSTIKKVDYIDAGCYVVFDLLVQTGTPIGLSELQTCFEYGCVHGYGAERSQDWGRYAYTIEKLEAEQTED